MKQLSVTESVSRIEKMENCFDALLEMERNGQPEESDFQELLAQLICYYDSPLWLRDYTLDEEGLLPQTLKRGVLSQDGVYNLLERLEVRDHPMVNRKRINDALVNWIRETVSREYPEDISLVCIYGSWLNGTMNEKSDVDCYFVPKTQRGYELARTFILEGVGYDIFPVSWERLEDIAALSGGMHPLVADVQILYSASQTEEDRLRGLQKRLQENLRDDAYVQKVSSQIVLRAAERYASAVLCENESQRWSVAGHVIALLAEAMVLRNHDYFHFGMKLQYEDLQNRFPGPIADGYRKVTEADNADQALQLAGRLLDMVCEQLDVAVSHVKPEAPQEQPACQTNAAILAEIYQEISSTFNKIYLCCQKGNYVLAFLSGGILQMELDSCREFGCPQYALMKNYHYQALEAFSEATRKIEEDLTLFIRNNGARIRAYDSFEAFAADNCV